MASGRRRRTRIASSSDDEAPSASGSTDNKRPKLDNPSVDVRDDAENAAASSSVTVVPIGVGEILRRTEDNGQHAPPTTPACKAARKRTKTQSTGLVGLEVANEMDSHHSATGELVVKKDVGDDEQSNFMKIKAAARQYLRSHLATEGMERRLETLKDLSPDSLQRFCMSNKARRKGEWIWDVLDACRVDRTSDSETIQVAPPNPVATDIVETLASDSEKLPDVQPNPVSTDDTLACDTMNDSVCSIDHPALSELLAEIEGGQQESSIPTPASSLMVDNPPLAATAVTEPTQPVLVQAELRHGVQTRNGGRAFTPTLQQKRGSTRLEAPSLRRMADSKAEVRVGLGRSSMPPLHGTICRHDRRIAPDSTNGYHWVCSKCGEMLIYDGFRAEWIPPSDRQFRQGNGQTMLNGLQ